MIRGILFAVFILILVACIAILVKISAKNASGKKKGTVDLTAKSAGAKKTKLAVTIVAVASFVMMIFIPGSFHQVEAGQVAVVKSLGKVVGTRYPGTYFDFYLTNTYTYFDTTIQKLDIQTVSYSSDAQTMDISMTVQYKIEPAKAENILIEYTNMSSLAQRIEKVADDKSKVILSKYTAMKIIETRASISPEVEETIKAAVDDHYYVTVTAVNLTNIDFTAEFEKSVEDKVIAEQQKEAAITKAEQELEVAKLTAQAKIEAARGDAESQKIVARASAEAMAIKIVELARSLGFQVEESYIKQTETVITNGETGAKISEVVKEEEVTEKPETSVVVTKNEEQQIVTTTVTMTGTKYSIMYDETHTKEDLQIIVEFVKYLEYLEKWDGKLPEVMTGTNGVDIMIPSPGQDGTTTA